MKVVDSLDQIDRDDNTVVTVGTFDGLHRAHQEIIREVVNRAKMVEGRSVVITFNPHPKTVVGSSPDDVRLLSTIEERVEHLRQMRVDVMFIISFTYDFSRLSSRQFYEQYVVRGLGVREVVVGYDHMFGRDREAGIEELVRMGKTFGFSVFAVHPYAVDGEVVSSTKIRQALNTGDVVRAATLLGRPYMVEGSVVKGDGRGRTIGYPTANIRPAEERKVIPGNGVYLVGVRHEGTQYFGMMNIGVRPTVTSNGERTLEVHIFDFDKPVYGEKVVIAFLQRLREEKKFSSVQDLVAQLNQDRDVSLRLLAKQYTQK